jgi:hypothetical protein
MLVSATTLGFWAAMVLVARISEIINGGKVEYNTLVIYLLLGSLFGLISIS